jgi:hypothetical protein
MEGVKIIMPAAERKPCVCGATVCVSRTTSYRQLTEVWLCSDHCGARGLTYEGALRRKIRLDLLSWGDLRRNAQALIAAHSDEQDTSPSQCSKSESQERLATNQQAPGNGLQRDRALSFGTG